MPYFVYILQSDADGSYYIGSSRDLSERLERHNQGRSQYTKAKRPWKLVYSEEFPDRSSAMRREAEIKGKKRASFIESLVRTSRMVMREGREFEPRRPSHKIKGLASIRLPLFLISDIFPPVFPPNLKFLASLMAYAKSKVDQEISKMTG